MKNLLAEWSCDVPATDVFRMLGYPDEESVSEPVREICSTQVSRLESLVSYGDETQLAAQTVELVTQRRAAALPVDDVTA